jgi:kynurenine 3-monooxygenase
LSLDPAIIGGGLAGSLAAIFLSRAGYDVTLYERRADIRESELAAGRSINLALAERGIAALKGAGVHEAVADLALPMRGRMIHDRDGNTSLQPYSQNPGEVIYSISRAELNRRLLNAAEAAGAALRFDHCCIDAGIEDGVQQYQRASRSRVVEHRAAPVIAADGAGSIARRSLMEAAGTSSDDALLDHAYKELTIAPDEHGGHRMDPAALHIWPRGGYMLIALPNLDGSFTATLFLANVGRPSFASLTDARAVDLFFKQEFPDAAGLITDVAEQFFTNPKGTLGTVWCPRWHANGTALLIGDAAHAIVPFHGQGMNCAFEDCQLLDAALKDHDGDYKRTFESFATMRKPDTDALAQMALENYVEMRDSVRDPDFKLQKEIGWMLEARHPNRFVPRYSMVMFRTLPYAQAFERGRIQQDILIRLSAGIESAGRVDFVLADELVQSRLPPL